MAALLAGQSGSLPELAAGAVGGSTALMSHLVKAGTRMAVNTSPEPFSNIAVSIAEDLGVAGIITFAIFHPLAAAIIAGDAAGCSASWHWSSSPPGSAGSCAAGPSGARRSGWPGSGPGSATGRPSARTG